MEIRLWKNETVAKTVYLHEKCWGQWMDSKKKVNQAFDWAKQLVEQVGEIGLKPPKKEEEFKIL